MLGSGSWLHGSTPECPAPGVGYTAPVPECSTPGVGYTAPGAEYTTPGVEYTTPVPEYTTPGVEDITPVPGYTTRNYSEADGELLGIVAPGGGGDGTIPGAPAGVTAPIIELSTLVAFEVGVKFRKFGMEGIRIEYRHTGGEWLAGGVLMHSPGVFTVIPATPNTPEQIEVRAVYLQNDAPASDYSDTGSVFVGP